jgi:DNA-binding CsgD family transcriptional regulator
MAGRPEVPKTTLRPRQRECLHWVSQGKSSADIGRMLGLSPRTVDEHVRGACSSLEVRTRVQAVARAIALGLIDPQ